jgi:hypothetical protein
MFRDAIMARYHPPQHFTQDCMFRDASMASLQDTFRRHPLRLTLQDKKNSPAVSAGEFFQDLDSIFTLW